MADTITTNADLQAYEVMLDVDINRTGTAYLNAQNPVWESRHKEAWAMTLRRLSQRNPAIEESDITDTSVLKRAVCYYVAYLAFRWGSKEDDPNRAQWWYGQWEREVEEVPISDEIQAGGYGYMIARRA